MPLTNYLDLMVRGHGPGAQKAWGEPLRGDREHTSEKSHLCNEEPLRVMGGTLQT